MAELVIPRRYRGPPESANGGYACGAVAAFLDGPAEVTLRSPPPLDRPLEVQQRENGVCVVTDGRLVAEATPTTLALDPPPPPSFEEATAATGRYPWQDRHPLPGCFVCGPQRSPGDGLCLFPGPVEGRQIAAAPFVPDATLVDEAGLTHPEIVWAALDCPSWFGYLCLHPDFSDGALLGRQAVRIDERPRLGERCVCVGWFIAGEGRKLTCGAALYSETGALQALGRATWIVLR